MNRKDFLKKSCLACAGVLAGAALLESCAGVKHASGTLTNDGLLLPISEFKQGEAREHSYVIARHESLQYPICVYRASAESYTAVLLRCTHQGAELQVAGERLTCPAHGSEFGRDGKVLQGPAAQDLRRFPVSIQGDKLFIDLRKQTS